MTHLEIHIPGPAVAQSRPRFARRGNHVATYDATPSRDYKSWVKQCAIEAMKQSNAGLIPREVPLKIVIAVTISRPASIPKKRLMPTVKPDLDNIVKTIQDALEGIVYQADQQIVSIFSDKQYGFADCVSVGISEYQKPF
jgi:Holliday junction resolvase RusA-like endonuclease